MQDYLAIGSPCAGGLFSRTTFDREARLGRRDAVRAGIECEIAVRLGRDLDATGAADPDTLAGSIDSYFGDPLITLLLEKAGEDVSIVTVDYHTAEGHMMFGLLSSPGSDIRSVDDIGDEEVAISEGSVIEYFLDEILAIEGFEGEAEKTAIANMPVRYQSLIEGNVELALLPEPLATMAIEDGAHLIADDSNVNTTATVIVMRESFVEANGEMMSAFLDAYGEAVQTIADSPGDHMDLLVENARFPEDLVGSYQLQPLSMPALPSEEDLARLQQWMMDNDLLSEEIPYSELVSEELYD